MAERGRAVYSTGPSGPTDRPAPCPHCKVSPCRCARGVSRPLTEHDIRVSRVTSGRKGKTVTVAGPFMLTNADAAALLKRLKQRCGGGGTLRATTTRTGSAAHELEIQGDHVAPILAELAALGYRAKQAGG